MKRISLVILKIFLIFIIIQNIYAPTIMAEDGFWGEVITKGNEFLEEGKPQNDEDMPIDNTKVQSGVEKIYSMLFIIGVVLMVLVGAILGIIFIIGSIEEKAKIKEMLMPYIVGCAVIFGAFSIWKLAIILLKDVVA